MYRLDNYLFVQRSRPWAARFPIKICCVVTKLKQNSTRSLAFHLSNFHQIINENHSRIYLFHHVLAMERSLHWILYKLWPSGTTFPTKCEIVDFGTKENFDSWLSNGAKVFVYIR